MLKKRILLSASLFHAINDGASITVPMLFPLLYSQQFLITKYSHIGILANLGLFVTFTFQLILAHYAYRFKYKYMLLLSIAGISLLLWIVTFSSSFASLLIFYLFLRISLSIYHPMGIASVSRNHPDKGLDFAMGIQSGSGNLGVFIAFISVGYISQSSGWKMPLYIWALAAVIFGFISFSLLIKNHDSYKGTSKPDISLWLKTLKGIKNLIPGFIFGGACWGTTVYYAPSLFNHKYHITLGRTGIYLAAWILLGTITLYAFGYLCLKIGRANIALISLGGSTLLVFLLGIAPSITPAVIFLLIFGAFLFLLFPAFQSCVAKQVPAQNQIIAFSLVANIQILTGAVVILISGFISDIFGINYPFIFLAILGVLVTSYYLAKPFE